MSLKITESSLLTKKYLEVRPNGVKFGEVALFSGGKTHPFRRVDCVLMSPDHKLSVQVGQEVFGIQTDPFKKKHKEVIDALVREVKRASGVS